MRKLFILIITLFSLTLSSQEINKIGNGFTEIVKIDSLSKSKIYSRAKSWIALNYKSANDVIQLDSADEIIVKGNFEITNNVRYNIKSIYYHTLILAFKEGRYKVDLVLNSMSLKSPPIKSVSVSPFQAPMDLTGEFPLEEKFIAFIGNPSSLSEEEIKTIFVNAMVTMVREKKALKIWGKNKEDYLNFDSDKWDSNKALYAQLKSKTKSIFSSLENYIANKEKDNDW